MKPISFIFSLSLSFSHTHAHAHFFSLFPNQEKLGSGLEQKRNETKKKKSETKQNGSERLWVKISFLHFFAKTCGKLFRRRQKFGPNLFCVVCLLLSRKTLSAGSCKGTNRIAERSHIREFISTKEVLISGERKWKESEAGWIFLWPLLLHSGSEHASSSLARGYESCRVSDFFLLTS